MKSVFLFIILIASTCQFADSISFQTDTINSTLVLRDSDTVVSSRNVFRLGFFSPNGTTRRYVGIWYVVSPEVVPWVANRDAPVNDSSGSFSISSDGNLVVRDGGGEIVWSSNVPASNSSSNATARLTDRGDLILEDSVTGNTIWESFRHPVETFLPDMVPSNNPRTGALFGFNSWRSLQDPAHGSFNSGVYAVGIPQVYIWEQNRTLPRWRSGPWNGRVFTGVTRPYSLYRDPFALTTDDDGTVSIIWGGFQELVRIYLSPDGVLANFEWHPAENNWNFTWGAPVNDCDLYNFCGPSAFCNIEAEPVCSCLRGYVPRNESQWRNGVWGDGCVRRSAFRCENASSNGTTRTKEDGFIEQTFIKVPEFALRVPALENECRGLCLRNCSCLAYAYDPGIGCMLWSGSLIDVQQFPDANAGSSFYIRVAHSELDEKKNNRTLVFLFSGIGSFIVLCLCIAWAWWMCKRRRKKGLLDANGTVNTEELPPLFSFEVLSKATNNFNLANKLGSGGFGPVFKGKLANDKNIAVKRLSEVSVQGFEEFMNEVVVISKLQHRNLVRLLGCCVDKEEKMLVYEYVENGSLNFFLFDKKQNVLDWNKRLKIIEGIGRGLMYLHRDSRLKIIHRDLKPSNVLLDEEWNPKISDFGTARIFGGNQEQAETGKVVGTYGYMAPEYIIAGRFSEKSDVYSFGVLVLEIISGRKNTSFFEDGSSPSLSLVGHAWKLWKEGNAEDLIDNRIHDPSLYTEMLRCMNIGLLCVQESYANRPSISTVLSMLSSEIVDLPVPGRPGFTDRLMTDSNDDMSNSYCSNKQTITLLEAR